MDERNMIMQMSHLVSDGISEQGDENIIIDIFAANNGSLHNDQISLEIQKLFQITISHARIEGALNRLKRDNKIYSTRNNILLASESIMDTIAQRKQHNESVEAISLEEWSDNYNLLYPGQLQDNQKHLLHAKIAMFLKTVFLRHGVECYDLLAGDTHNNSFNIKQIADELTCQETEPQRKQYYDFLIGIFSSAKTSSQHEYMINILNKAIRYVSMVGDKSLIKAITDRLKGLKLYLDSSIIYRLLNLQGEARYKTISAVIDSCKKHNITLKLFKKTKEELVRRINYDAKIIEKYPTPINLASIGYKSRTSDNYISTFWNERMRTKVSAKDFNYRYSNILAILNDLQIELDDEDYDSVIEISQSYSDLTSKVQNFDTSNEDEKKSLNAVEHDAFCLAAISYLQKKNVDSIVDTKCIFLSTDWSLINLQRYDHEYKNRQKIVLLPSQLLQLFCFTQPDYDYSETFFGLFSSSSTIFGTSGLSNEQIQEIIGRIGMYAGMTPQLAERILGNQLIQKTFSESADDEEKNDLIHEALIEAAHDTETSLELTKKEYEDLKKEQENLFGELNKTKQEQKQQQTEYEDRIYAIEKQISELIRQRDNTYSILDSIKRDRDVSKSQMEKLTFESKEAYTTIQRLEQKTLETENENEKLSSILKKNAKDAANRYRISLLLPSIFCLSLGLLLLVVSLCALIPGISSVVEPFFFYINSGKLLSGSTQTDNLALIGIIVAISIPLISAGIYGIKSSNKFAKWIESKKLRAVNSIKKPSIQN